MVANTNTVSYDEGYNVFNNQLEVLVELKGILGDIRNPLPHIQHLGSFFGDNNQYDYHTVINGHMAGLEQLLETARRFKSEYANREQYITQLHGQLFEQQQAILADLVNNEVMKEINDYRLNSVSGSLQRLDNYKSMMQQIAAPADKLVSQAEQIIAAQAGGKVQLDSELIQSSLTACFAIPSAYYKNKLIEYQQVGQINAQQSTICSRQLESLTNLSKTIAELCLQKIWMNEPILLLSQIKDRLRNVLGFVDSILERGSNIGDSDKNRLAELKDKLKSLCEGFEKKLVDAKLTLRQLQSQHNFNIEQMVNNCHVNAEVATIIRDGLEHYLARKRNDGTYDSKDSGYTLAFEYAADCGDKIPKPNKALILVAAAHKFKNTREFKNGHGNSRSWNVFRGYLNSQKSTMKKIISMEQKIFKSLIKQKDQFPEHKLTAKDFIRHSLLSLFGKINSKLNERNVEHCYDEPDFRRFVKTWLQYSFYSYNASFQPGDSLNISPVDFDNHFQKLMQNQSRDEFEEMINEFTKDKPVNSLLSRIGHFAAEPVLNKLSAIMPANHNDNSRDLQPVVEASAATCYR